jgi:hypothetical protein
LKYLHEKEEGKYSQEKSIAFQRGVIRDSCIFDWASVERTALDVVEIWHFEEVKERKSVLRIVRLEMHVQLTSG